MEEEEEAVESEGTSRNRREIEQLAGRCMSKIWQWLNSYRAAQPLLLVPFSTSVVFRVCTPVRPCARIRVGTYVRTVHVHVTWE